MRPASIDHRLHQVAAESALVSKLLEAPGGFNERFLSDVLSEGAVASEQECDSSRLLDMSGLQVPYPVLSPLFHRSLGYRVGRPHAQSTRRGPERLAPTAASARAPRLGRGNEDARPHPTFLSYSSPRASVWKFAPKKVSVWVPNSLQVLLACS